MSSAERWGLKDPIQKCGATNRNPAASGMWYARGESRHRRDDSEALHPRRGVLYKSGVYARNVLSLTPGDLPVVPSSGLRAGRPALTGREESAEGIVVLRSGTKARTVPARGEKRGAPARCRTGA